MNFSCSLRSFLKSLSSKSDSFSRSQLKRNFSLSGCDYKTLEDRKMLASVSVESGVLNIFGSDAVDRVVVARVDGGATLRVNATTAGVQDFDPADVNEILFIGVGGDDFFDNRTDLPSRAFGNNGNDTLIGGSGDDVLVGGGGNDNIRGGAGDDTIRGGGSSTTSNILTGGDGNDRLFGGLGENTIRGNAGDDVIFGNSGDDEVEGGDGNDQLFVGNGDNTVRGGDGDDIVIGGAGVDIVFGEDGVDRIYTLGGDDVLEGGNDLDLLFGGAGDDRHIGGAGNDQIRTGTGNDFVDGGTGDDFISGFQGNNTLNGGGGNDRINAGAGNDTVNGGDGNDRLFGQAGDDVIEGGAGDDFILGDAGDNLIRGGNGNDEIFGGAGDDFLEGGGGDDLIFGFAGNDSLFGSAGNDVLLGLDGLDGLSGGTGSDIVRGGRGADRFLDFSGDDRPDFRDNDALVEFRSGDLTWTHREIEIVDEGLRRLHIRTGGTRVLRDPLDPGPLQIFKQSGVGNEGEAGINQLTNSFTFDTTGQIISEVFTRRIELNDWDENDERASEFSIETTIHEIAHSWDSAREINEVFAGQGNIWDEYLEVNGWRTSPAAGFTQAAVQSTEAFDLEFDPATTTFTQINTTWYYRNGAQFAREYGRTNAQEDWATLWEAAVSDDPQDRVGLSAHIAVVDRLFDLL